MFFKRVCSSWLILLLQKRHQVQDVFDYLLEDVRHMVHAGQRLWHLHSSSICFRIQCWLLIFADTALRGQSLDYNRWVWSDSGTHLPDWILEWFLEAFCAIPLSTLPPWPALPAWSLPESCWHSAASFHLTVDSVIEPKRGTCSHGLRTCRSRETFLHVRKRKKKKKEEKHTHFPIFWFLFSFIQHILLGASCVPSFVLSVDWGFKGDDSSRIYSLAGEERHINRVRRSQGPCYMFVLGPGGTRKKWTTITIFSLLGFGF